MNAAETLVPAFVLGIASAAHCAAMCGVFAMRAGGMRRFACYALGKTTTYAALGAVAGSLGAGAVTSLGEIQGVLGIAAAAVLVVAGVRMLVPRRAAATAGTGALVAPLAEAVARARATGSAFLFGAATGALPCGAVYAAAAQGAATASPTRGALAMAAFGFATVPVLAVTAIAGRGALMRLGPARVRMAGAVLILASGAVMGVRAALPLLSGGEPACCR